MKPSISTGLLLATQIQSDAKMPFMIFSMFDVGKVIIMVRMLQSFSLNSGSKEVSIVFSGCLSCARIPYPGGNSSSLGFTTGVVERGQLVKLERFYHQEWKCQIL